MITEYIDTPWFQAHRRMFSEAMAQGRVTTHRLPTTYIGMSEEEVIAAKKKNKADWHLRRKAMEREKRQNTWFDHEPKKPAGTHIPRFGQVRPFA